MFEHRVLVPLIPACPQAPLIDFICSNQGHTLYSTRLTTRASVSGGQYAGLIENQGLISQATILSGAVITGGVLSGCLVNEGILENITFVGARLTGGFLAGVIENNSQVGGIIENVTLLPNTRIRGGRVKGLIKGNPAQPALLENVLILPKSQLEHVILGPGTFVME